jgi:hypothetical protein
MITWRTKIITVGLGQNFSRTEGDVEIKALLKEGWEPFAVTPHPSYETSFYYHLRKQEGAPIAPATRTPTDRPLVTRVD